MLYASWEDVTIGIAGPRVGKTTALVVPAILAAPGALLTTSNKPDTVETTRKLRDEVGATWVFDPQQVVDEEPTWWWNPLSYVTDDTTAAKLAGHFASGSREPGDKGDAYFDPAGKNLLAGMLLAAALDGRAITEVFTWLTDSRPRAAASPRERHGSEDGGVPAEQPHRPVGDARRRKHARRPPTAVQPRRVRARHRHPLLTLQGG